jgi:histidinol phosphatase-like enzyme
LRLLRELGLDLARSWLVGDAPRDIEAGRNAGIGAGRCLLIGPGQNLPDLGAATRVILRA